MPSRKIEKLKKEIGEVRLLLDGLLAYEEIPGPIIELAISKADQLKSLLQELNDESLADKPFPIVKKEPVDTIAIKSENSPQLNPKPIKEKVVEKELLETDIPNTTILEEKKELEEPKNLEVSIPEIEEEQEIVIPVNEFQPSEEGIETNENPVEDSHNEQSIPNTKSVLGDTLGTHKKVMNDVMADNGNNTLGKRMEASAINDLKRAIPINDRFRFQRDLFGNNVSLFNETLARLNTMPNFDEAREYLLQEFEWDEELNSTRDFFVLLGRRFVK